MILTLTAVSHNDRRLTPVIAARFDDHGGTIGRADHNTLALPDPERFISRLQAEIVASGSSFLIRNVGSANAILIGNQTLAGGQASVVRHGDEIRIGGYLLQADCPAADPNSPDATRPTLPSRPLAPVAPPVMAAPAPSIATPVAAPIAPPIAPPVAAPVAPWVAPVGSLAPLKPVAAASMPAAAPLRPAPPMAPSPSLPPRPMAASPRAESAPLPAQPVAGLSGSNPFADLLGPAATPSQAADPFADLFGTPAPAPSRPVLPAFQPAPLGIDERSAALPPPPAPSASRLPDDFDPFAAAPPSRPAPPAAATADPFADLLPAAPSAGIDQAFGLASNRQEDPLANFLSDLGPPAAGPSAPGVSTDPLALFGAPLPTPAEPPAPAQPDHVPALHAAYTPPRVHPPAPPPARPQPVPLPPPAMPPAPVAMAPLPATATHGQDAQAMWDAFCAGAGVQLPLPPGNGPERMQVIGAMLRSAIDGTLQLMAVRASTKHELRAAVTMIQQRNNNPLKFSPDAGTAIEQLLQPPARGFVDGPTALEEAMHDLVGHSIGTVAGMRAAIEGMLGRFDPAELEAKLARGSMLDTLLPMNRRARLWDLYLQHHDTIRDEAQEDFHNLFGKAFLAAYEQQIERLRLEQQRR